MIFSALSVAKIGGTVVVPTDEEEGKTIEMSSV